ncbi:MFS transporter [Nocardia vinacea]|uniref:MFS transporter n=1 Tax=Nocardia vinacea TaxID=96468 RepID=UPI0033D53597
MHPQTSAHHHHDVASPPDPRRWRALGVLAVAQFMLILDITVVTVALPDIGSDLELSRAATTWVITAYTLLFGGLMIFGGRAADLFGARRMAMIGLAVFTSSSLLAGLAVNAPLLIGGRIGQGIGAALLSPAAMSIVTTTFHGAERNKALGVWGALGGTGAAVGVLTGGLLTAGPGWEWIFFVNVPVGIVLLAAMTKVVPDRPAQRGRSIDVACAVLVTTAAGAAIPAVWHSTPALIIGLSVAAAGQGATIVTATTTALANIEHSQAGVTSGLVNTFHEVGAAFGVSVISTIAAVSLRTLGADPSGFTNAFTTSALVAAVVAVAAAAFIPAGKPPAGMRVSTH